MLFLVFRRTLIAAVYCHRSAWYPRPDRRCDADQNTKPPFTLRITSPLGRTGQPGTVGIVARLTGGEDRDPFTLQFFVDQELVGTDDTGPSYAVEWVDDNPFEPREIRVHASDASGATA